MITKAEQQQILSILQDPRWQVVEAEANKLCDLIRYDTVVSDTSYGTLKNALMNEGQVVGIKKLLNHLYKLAQHDKT